MKRTVHILDKCKVVLLLAKLDIANVENGSDDTENVVLFVLGNGERLHRTLRTASETVS